MAAPERQWQIAPWFGLRVVLAIIAIILYVVYLTSATPNIHTLAWAGIITAVAVLVP